jgi:predicted DNA-binding WGR domain protein
MKTPLRRIVNERERYYEIELIANLFGDYLLIRTYGGSRRSKPTRCIQQSFKSYCEANTAFHKLLEEKSKRGYALSGSNIGVLNRN